MQAAGKILRSSFESFGNVIEAPRRFERCWQVLQLFLRFQVGKSILGIFIEFRWEQCIIVIALLHGLR